MTNRNKFTALALVLVTLACLVFAKRATLTTVADTFAGGVSGSITRNTALKSVGDSRVADALFSDNGTTATVAGAQIVTGQLSTTRDPSGTTNTLASLLVNPATSATNELLLGLLDNGTSKFTVDKEGDTVTAGNAAVTGTLTMTGASGLAATTVSTTLGVTGVSSLTGGALIGSGGATILKVLTGTASVDFTALAAGACENFNITVTGAADGDVVSVGIPAAAWATTEYATINAFISATNTATVKRCNLTNATTALSNPAAVTVRATVIQF